MALDPNINTLEKAKFREVAGGEVVVAVTNVDSDPAGQPASNTPIVGSVGTTATAYPTVAGTNITGFMVKCAVDQPSGRRLLYSYDGGTTFHTLRPGDADSIELFSAVTQLYLKAAASTTAFELHLARAA